MQPKSDSLHPFYLGDQHIVAGSDGTEVTIETQAEPPHTEVEEDACRENQPGEDVQPPAVERPFRITSLPDMLRLRRSPNIRRSRFMYISALNTAESLFAL